MSAAPRALTLVPRLVLYDGVCNLCNAGIAWVAKRDTGKSIAFCAVQSRSAKPYLLASGTTREAVLKRFIFLQEDKISEASTAALEVAGYLNFPWPLAQAFLVVPRQIRDPVYDYVASNRYRWFGRTQKCQVPSAEVLERCIDAAELQAASRHDGPKGQQ
ncbi:g10808 [Coccomyxa viridis]|uniref:G10808 protein n=1 Tax=Coccomyxa viridis TaxID=1274662 RepID=A0ABP1GAI5_9CHLO